MAAPVWVLSVDLQTKTATFQSGMADAAKSARGAFNDIKSGAGDMGGAVNYSMGEARHSVMLLGEEFGVHLPRALSTFIAGLGPIGPALEMAFPFLAIAVGATLLIEHLVKMHEAGEKLTEDQSKFGSAVETAWNSLDQKIIQAKIRSDELRNDHLGALRLQLELIDKQSMNELIHSFEEVAKAGDVVMKELEGHWYTFGRGSEGAKSALDKFQTQYTNLLASGKQEDADKAGGLLSGTLAQAKKTLGLLQQIQTAGRSNQFGQFADPAKFHAAQDELNKMGIAHGEEVQKQIEAQENLVGILNAQVGSQERIAALAAVDKGNAKTAESKSAGRDAAKLYRESVEAGKQAGDEADRYFEESFKRSLTRVEDSERAKLEATKKGTSARLIAIQAALKEEESLGMQSTDFYRSLLNQKIELTRQLSEEAKEQQAEAGREEASNTEKLGMLAIAAEREKLALQRSARREAADQMIAEDVKLATEQYALKMGEFLREQELLDKTGKDYQNHLKQLQDQEKQLTKQHLNELATIKDKAEQEQNARLLSAEHQAAQSVAEGLSQSITGHQTWAKMVTSLGQQAAEGLIKNSIMVMLQQDKERLSDARKAATSAYTTGEKIGGPAGLVLGPVFAAAAFAGVMAFEKGGVVPGVGHGDVVPSMLSPGEGIVPGGVMDGLSKMAREGGFGKSGPIYHLQLHPTYHIQTIDGDGMQAALEKHTDTLQRHVENTLRKMNR